jgi:hypothetical protein
VTTAFTRLRARDQSRWRDLRRAASTAALATAMKTKKAPQSAATSHSPPATAMMRKTGVAADHDAGDGDHRSDRGGA